MDISLISISHKNAPLEVRARFAFPVEAQEELMRQVIARRSAYLSVPVTVPRSIPIMPVRAAIL